METISYSALDTYQRCPQKYKLSYHDRLTKGEVEVSPATMGVAIHAGMSYGLLRYWQTNYDLDIAVLTADLLDFFNNWAWANVPELKEGIDEYGDTVIVNQDKVDNFWSMVDESRQIVLRTFRHLDVPRNWRTVDYEGTPLIEYRGQIPMLEGVDYVFVIDWVAEDVHTGLRYVVDWKSRRSFQDDESESTIGGEDFNTQITLYQAALFQLGVETQGTITYQIAPYVPKEPQRLMSSSRFSKSNIRTDWDTYAATLRAGGENPDDPYYADMREKLEGFEWFKPVMLYRSQVEIANRWNTAIKWARRIQEDTVFPKVESVMCRFCPFNQICLAEDRGYDLDIIIETEYTKRQSTITQKELLNGI